MRLEEVIPMLRDSQTSTDDIRETASKTGTDLPQRIEWNIREDHLNQFYWEELHWILGLWW